MPGRAARECGYPGCRVLVRDGSGRCDKHPPAGWSKPPVQRTAGRKLQRLRAQLFKRSPLCVECEKKGRVALATIRDHVTPLAEGGLDREDNVQALCAPCHTLKTLAESARGRTRPEIAPVSCRLVIVCGPPGAGKSTYVAEQAGPSDEVIDLDEIRARLSGRPLYDDSTAWLDRALEERNRALSLLASKPPSHTAWLIVSAPGKETRQWWSSKLKPAQIVVLDTPLPVCVARIRADARRAEVEQKHVDAAASWWRIESGYSSNESA